MIDIQKYLTIFISNRSILTNIESEEMNHFDFSSSLKRVHIISLGIAVSNSAFFFAMVAFMSLGPLLINENKSTFENVFMYEKKVSFKL